MPGLPTTVTANTPIGSLIFISMTVKPAPPVFLTVTAWLWVWTPVGTEPKSIDGGSTSHAYVGAWPDPYSVISVVWKFEPLEETDDTRAMQLCCGTLDGAN